MIDLLHGEQGVFGSLFQQGAHNLQFLLHLGHILRSSQQLGLEGTGVTGDQRESLTWRGLEGGPCRAVLTNERVWPAASVAPRLPRGREQAPENLWRNLLWPCLWTGSFCSFDKEGSHPFNHCGCQLKGEAGLPGSGLRLRGQNHVQLAVAHTLHPSSPCPGHSSCGSWRF